MVVKEKNTVENLTMMTQEGYDKLVQELEYREMVKRNEISENVKVARDFGDLKENSEYHEAKEAQGENEARIIELKHILKNARVLDEKDISLNEVSLGASVHIREGEQGEVSVYMIVSSKEEDIFENKISSDSQVGKALLGRRKGEVVEVKTPMGHVNYTILKIER